MKFKYVVTLFKNYTEEDMMNDDFDPYICDYTYATLDEAIDKFITYEAEAEKYDQNVALWIMSTNEDGYDDIENEAIYCKNEIIYFENDTGIEEARRYITRSIHK